MRIINNFVAEQVVKVCSVVHAYILVLGRCVCVCIFICVCVWMCSVATETNLVTTLLVFYICWDNFIFLVVVVL